MKKSALVAAAALVVTFAAGQGEYGQSAQAAEANIELGTLNCSVEGGFGFIIGSNKAMTCVFSPADGADAEYYEGTIEKAGVDIGWTEDTIIGWVVLAGSDTYEPGSLAGTYGGASAEATVGVGIGANALVGGLNHTFTLQPLSVQAQTGLNIAGGLTRVRLNHVH